MQALRRGAQASARSARTTLRQSQRRCESSSHGSSTSHGHHDSASAPFDPNQRLGAGFYVGVASIPVIFLIHDLATSKDPYLTRVIGSYADYKDEWLRRNDLHEQAVAQAAADRNLFLNSKGGNKVELMHNEYVNLGLIRGFGNPTAALMAFNQGSPYNVWAGAYTNLDKVIAHYQQQNDEEQARRVKSIEEGKAGNGDYDPKLKNFTRQPLP